MTRRPDYLLAVVALVAGLLAWLLLGGMMWR